MNNEMMVPMTEYLSTPNVSKYLDQLLGERKGQFAISLSTIMNGNYRLQQCERKSILDCALQATGMNLSMNPSLGHCHPVPYNTKDGWKAQFQMGWRGYVQLALRTGQYKFINVIEVYENQFESFDAFNEVLKADFTVEGKGRIVGYVAKFVLNSGFEKTLFWTTERVRQHGMKYSKSFDSESGQWKNGFNDMAKKTVIKQLLQKFGIMSIELEEAIQKDQAIIETDYSTGEQRIVYADNPNADHAIELDPIEQDEPERTTWEDVKKKATPVQVATKPPVYDVHPASEMVLNFGKHKGKKLCEIEAGYLKWLIEQPIKEGRFEQETRDRNQKIEDYLDYLESNQSIGENPTSEYAEDAYDLPELPFDLDELR